MPKIQQWSIIENKPSVLRLAYDAFMIAQEAAKHSPSTLDFYRKRLPRFLDFLTERGISDPNGITPTDIRAFILELQRQGLSDHYVHQHAQIIKTFCRFLEEEGYADHNAFARVKMPKVDNRVLPAFSPDDVKSLLAACQTARDRAVVLCLLDTGSRASEFVALNVGDVDLKTGAVRVERGKGGRGRVCYLGAKARQALLRYLKERPMAGLTDPLWLTHKGGHRLTYSGLAQLLRKLGQAAGVKHCQAHTFRRTSALWSLRAGMSIYHVKAMLGHSGLHVLQRYLALVESDCAEAHKRFGASVAK